MRRWIILILFCSFLVIPTSALEFEPPVVPDSGEDFMPDNTESFGEGLWFIIKQAIEEFMPSVSDASAGCLTMIAVSILVSVLDQFSGSSGRVVHLASAVMIGIILLSSAGTFIQMGIHTVEEMSSYGKLLIPVLTGALAAQGGVTSSSSLYVTTIFFITILTSLITKIIVPMLYIYFCISVVQCVADESILENIKNFLKWLITWGLKISLYGFSAFLTITGVVCGTADAAAVKTLKISISGMVPVVGGLISDASETILVSAGVLKNAAGIYGILALVAVFIGPFLKIGIQYLLLKITGAICGAFSGKEEIKLIKDFSTGMGMILGMTVTVCLLLLISVVCFIKGMA